MAEGTGERNTRGIKTPKKFYNDEIKRLFISSQPESTAKSYRRLFSLSYKYENEYGKDLHSFTLEEIERMYKDQNYATISAMDNIHGAARRYLRWCANTCLSAYDGFLENITRGMLEKYCNRVAFRKSVITREELSTWIRSQRESDIYNPRDCFVVLAIFEGINGQDGIDLMNLRFPDFSVENNEYFVQLSDRKITISEELYGLAVETAKTKVYMARHRGGGVRAFRLDETMDRLIRSRAMKSLAGKEQLRSRVRSICVQAIESLKLTVNSLQRSGELHYVCKYAKELGITPYQYLLTRHYVDNVCYRFGIQSKQLENHIKLFRNVLDVAHVEK